MNISLHIIVLILAVVQAAAVPKPPTVIGTNARQLSTQDIAELELLAGGSTWLLDAPYRRIGTSQGISSLSVDVFLQPRTVTRELRRGTVRAFVHLPAATAAAEMPGLWVRSSELTNAYAQVAVDAGVFDEIKGDKDTNRPFQVIGEFDDVELISLVRSIRSKPVSPRTKYYTPITVAGDSPIISIVRVNGIDPSHFAKSGQAVVILRQGDHNGQQVALQKKGQMWAVTAARGWLYGISGDQN